VSSINDAAACRVSHRTARDLEYHLCGWVLSSSATTTGAAGLRILFANDHARLTGGADVHCFELDRLLTARGHEVRLLSTLHPENLEATGAFVPQIVDRRSRDALPPKAAARVSALACWNRTVAAATEQILSEFQPDILHAHKLYPQLSVAPIVTAAKRSVPILQTAHDYEFVSASAVDDSGRRVDRDEDRASYRLLNSLLFAIKRTVHVPRVSAWITVSEDLAEVYRRKGRIESVALPNFVAPGARPLPREARTGVLFVGRLAREKGLDHVLELARRRPGLAVTVIGDGPLAEAVDKATKHLPNLTFSGPLGPDAVDHRVRSALAVVMPAAWREPAGLVALEAMRAGTPVVAYDRGGLAEYVRNAGSGIVTEPDIGALEKAVGALLDDPGLWRRLSASGAEAASATHAPDTYIARLESIYDTATSSAATRRG
jgi:glycosyltransferase involved in cell wall biosynthesis